MEVKKDLKKDQKLKEKNNFLKMKIKDLNFIISKTKEKLKEIKKDTPRRIKELEQDILSYKLSLKKYKKKLNKGDLRNG